MNWSGRLQRLIILETRHLDYLLKFLLMLMITMDLILMVIFSHMQLRMAG